MLRDTVNPSMETAGETSVFRTPRRMIMAPCLATPRAPPSCDCRWRWGGREFVTMPVTQHFESHVGDS
jgi:hypothetical protein